MVVATEATTLLNLVTAVSRNKGTNESGKIKACTNFKIASGTLASEREKVSRFALDAGGTTRKITQL